MAGKGTKHSWWVGNNFPLKSTIPPCLVSSSQQSAQYTFPSSGGCNEKWRTVSNHLNAHFALLYPAVLQFLLLVMRIGKAAESARMSTELDLLQAAGWGEWRQDEKLLYLESNCAIEWKTGNGKVCAAAAEAARMLHCKLNTSCSRSSRNST